jgi:homeobox protein cut-like
VWHPDFDIENWRTQVDKQALEIDKNQDNSLKNRRKLAESTRGE